MKFIQRIGFWTVILIFIFYTLVPFYWAVSTSFKSPQEAEQVPLTYLPQNPTLENYQTAINNDELLISIGNSFLVAGSVTILSLVVGGCAAFAIGRYRFYGRALMRYVVLSMNLFPTIAILPSLLEIITDYGLSGQIGSLIITYPIFMLPTTTWMLIPFFQSLAPDIEQAAYVDGASTFQLFYKIMLPITMPVLLTSGLVVFVVSLSEYLFAATFTAVNPEARTITIAIKFLREQLDVTGIMAASIILSIPLIILIFFTQRRFITNTTEGAVKG